MINAIILFVIMKVYMLVVKVYSYISDMWTVAMIMKKRRRKKDNPCCLCTRAGGRINDTSKDRTGYKNQAEVLKLRSNFQHEFIATNVQMSPIKWISEIDVNEFYVTRV